MYREALNKWLRQRIAMLRGTRPFTHSLEMPRVLRMILQPFHSFVRTRPETLLAAAVLLFTAGVVQAAPTLITATRVWPAADYTRITIESSKPISHTMLMLKGPDRLVLDLDDVELDSELKNLSSKILASDPYIQQVRTANFKPGVVRVVIDLKAEVKPSLFALQPAGEYMHRLVLDVYPLHDQLMALLDKISGQGAVTSSENESPGNIVPEDYPAPMNKPDSIDSDKKQQEVARLITVAIDAGHGGEDPGAVSRKGTREKDITLAIAKKFKKLIDAEPNMRGVLIRDGDYFIPLNGRVVKARKLAADLFVSIHADAYIRPEARGSSVFALSERGATSAMARYIAKSENQSDLIGGVSLDNKEPYLAKTLLDLSQTATINDSLKLGKAVLGHLGEINTLHKSLVEQAGFAVLKSPDIPSILVETAFLSNPEEEAKLMDDDYQTKLAMALLAGVKRYFSSNPPLAKSRMAM